MVRVVVEYTVQHTNEGYWFRAIVVSQTIHGIARGASNAFDVLCADIEKLT